MDQREFDRLVQQRHLELFLEMHFGAADLKPRFDFVKGPDLLIDFNGTTIGIEHTRHFVPHSGRRGLEPKTQETLQNKIVWKAERFYRETNTQPLWLAVEFEQPTIYYGNDVDLVARSLVMTVEQFLNEPYTEDVCYWLPAWRAKRLGRSLPNGISQILIEVLSDARFAVWGTTGGYAVPCLEASEVQKTTIDPKNDRVPEYLRRCSQVWLLIVVNDGSQSSHLDVEPEFLSHRFSSRFARVFLLRELHRELFELQVE